MGLGSRVGLLKRKGFLGFVIGVVNLVSERLYSVFFVWGFRVYKQSTGFLPSALNVEVLKFEQARVQREQL